MAFLCDSCKLLFPDKITNCPFCGGKIYSENISEESLLQDGYSQVNFKERSNVRHESASSFSIDDSEIIESLRNSYINEHNQAVSQDFSQQQSQQNTPTSSNSRTDNQSRDQNNQNKSNNSSVNNGGFFAQVQSSATTEEIPTITGTSMNSVTNSTSSFNNSDYLRQEQERMSEEEKIIQRELRRQSFLNFVSNINWRTLFRVILFICIVVFAIVIWKMRYVILQSILSFLYSLIPIIIIIAIIVYIIREMFRR